MDREILKYPPFGRMVGILFQGEQEEYVKQEAQRFAKLSRKYFKEKDILGPAPSLVARVRNQYRWQIMVRNPKSTHLRETIKEVRKLWERGIDNRKLNLKIDVDPVGLM